MLEYVLTDKEFSELSEITDILNKLGSLDNKGEFLEVKNSLLKKKESILDKYKDCFDFWTNKSFNKFWEVSLKDPKSFLYIYPYKYIEDNGLLFSVYFYTDNDYKSGLTDGSIDIRYLVNNSNIISYREVDRETFEENAKLNIMKPLIRRLKKL